MSCTLNEGTAGHHRTNGTRYNRSHKYKKSTGDSGKHTSACLSNYVDESVTTMPSCSLWKSPLNLIFSIFTGKKCTALEKEERRIESASGEKTCSVSREISSENRRKLVLKVQVKLEELKTLYNNSWDICKLKKEEEGVNPKNNKTIYKIQKLLEKVKNDFEGTQGNIEEMETIKLLEMTHNIDELNVEIRKMNNSLKNSMEVNMTEGDECICYQSLDNGDGPFTETMINSYTYDYEGSTSYDLATTPEQTTDETKIQFPLNFDTSSKNSKIKLWNKSISRCQLVFKNRKDDSHMGRILGTIGKIHKQLQKNRMQIYKSKMQEVTRDLLNIKKKLFRLAKEEMQMRRKMLKKEKEILEGVSLVSCDNSREISCTEYTIINQYDLPYIVLADRLEKIKRSYIALINLPKTEEMRNYQSDKMKKMISDLEDIRIETAALERSFDERSFCKETTFQSTEQSNDVTWSKESSCCDDPKSDGSGNKEKAENNLVQTSEHFKVQGSDNILPWDRGTNSLYQSMMYCRCNPMFKDNLPAIDMESISKVIKKEISTPHDNATSENNCLYSKNVDLDVSNTIEDIKITDLPPRTENAEEILNANRHNNDEGDKVVALKPIDEPHEHLVNINDSDTTCKKLKKLVKAGIKLFDRMSDRQSDRLKSTDEINIKIKYNKDCSSLDRYQDITNIEIVAKERFISGNEKTDVKQNNNIEKKFKKNGNKKSIKFKNINFKNARLVMLNDNKSRTCDDEQNNKTERNMKDIHTSYDNFLLRPEAICMEGVPFWRTRYKQLKTDDFVQDAIESLAKERNSDYSRAVMDIIKRLGTKGINFKIKYLNRSTSITGLQEGKKNFDNRNEQPPETWYKYSNFDPSTTSELLNKSYKSIDVQTQENGTNAGMVTVGVSVISNLISRASLKPSDNPRQNDKSFEKQSFNSLDYSNIENRRRRGKINNSQSKSIEISNKLLAMSINRSNFK